MLVLPAEMDQRIIRRALIAYTGTRQAVRAVHDSLPLLHRANAAVEIVTTKGSLSQKQVDRFRDHLCRHGIETRCCRDAVGGWPTAAILRHLNEDDFDLLIMGAYSRPAWIEFLFGGSTSSVLAKARKPILISH